MKLSIVIPTYNRNDSLVANISHLLPQMNANVDLVISDNASEVPVEQSLEHILAAYKHLNVRVLRNPTNIGANANILRAYEHATHPWLWILSDDDLVSPTAINEIFKSIEENPNVTFINFSTEVMSAGGMRRRTFDTTGQAGFIRGLDHAGNVNFMSVSIWRVEHVLPYLNVAYHYAYSMSPTFVLLLSALGDLRRCLFSHEVLILQVMTTNDAMKKWRFRDFVLGWNTILELPMTRELQSLLAKKMISWHAPENVCVYMLADAVMHGRDGRDFTMISRRLACYSSWGQRLRFLLYRLLFIWPKASWHLVESAIRIAVAFKFKGVSLTEIIERSRNSATDRR